MRPTPQLGELVAKHMSLPGHVPNRIPEADFVMSGLRAANSANRIRRAKILEDVSLVLGCVPDALDFLFAEFEMPVPQPANYEVMVPDFQTQLRAAR